MSRGKYTVNEVEERTRVPASTLRQWERRYGFPKPERSDSGYRLYSDEDLLHIDAMKRHIADGIPASRAAELVGRLKPTTAGPRSLTALHHELVAGLLKLDEACADRILSEAYSLHTVEAVMLELLRPAIIDIGTLWHEGHVNVTTEHWASAWIRGRLHALLDFSAHLRNAPVVIVACAPTEPHELGALILAVLLRRAGYHVVYVGANTPVKDLLEMARALHPTGVMLSASLRSSFDRLTEHRGVFEGMAPVVAFGGAAFDEAPDRARLLGGMYLGSETLEAVERFHKLVRERGVLST